MRRTLRFAVVTAAFGGLLAACADEAPLTAPASASFAKSGSAPSGGSGGGGGGGGGGGSKSPTPGTPGTGGGIPVGPTYDGYITKVGVVPVGFYYGNPTGWEVNGYPFASVFNTNYKPVAGGFVLGACVTINFYDNGTERIMQEIKTQSPDKCQ